MHRRSRAPSIGSAVDAGATSSSSSVTGGGIVLDKANALRKKPSKLRANRERRQRERSLDGDELEQKFSQLSFTAPAFTPGAMPGVTVRTSSRSAVTRSAPGSSKRSASSSKSSSAVRRSSGETALPLSVTIPPRSLALVTEREKPQSSAPSPSARPSPLRRTASVSVPVSPATGSAVRPRRTVTAKSNPTDGFSISNNMQRPMNVERRPRRQRIGAMGFSKAPAGGAGNLVPGRLRQGAAGSAPSAFGSSTSPLSVPRSLQQPQQPLDSSSQEDPDEAPVQRKRSDSVGSDSEYSSDDEVYPDEPSSASSAFPDRLTLFSQQKRIPKKVSRDAVIDTIFTALFTKKESSRGSSRGFSAFGDDTGTDTDNEPNEEFVKRGLAASLFKDHLGGSLLSSFRMSKRGRESPQEAIDRFITPTFIHTLVTDMRFEDFRTASARIDILRAIHKNCPSKRLHIARALTDATCLRLQYVTSLTETAHARSVEKSKVVVDHKTDHGHGFTELLRYAIEHIGESVNGFDSGEQPFTKAEVDEILRNYLLSLMCLWRAHWLDPAGSDEEDLIGCAGQFVAYLPEVTPDLLSRLISTWPSKYPTQEVVAIRMVARVIMSGSPLHTLPDGGAVLRVKIFSRLAKSVKSAHTQVAQEALAFTGCQFVMMHFMARYPEIFKLLSEAFHKNAVGHWNEAVRTTSEGHFDRALDFAT